MFHIARLFSTTVLASLHPETLRGFRLHELNDHVSYQKTLVLAGPESLPNAKVGGMLVCKLPGIGQS